MALCDGANRIGGAHPGRRGEPLGLSVLEGSFAASAQIRRSIPRVSLLSRFGNSKEEARGCPRGFVARTAANGEGRWAVFRFRNVLLEAFSPFGASPVNEAIWRCGFRFFLTSSLHHPLELKPLWEPASGSKTTSVPVTNRPISVCEKEILQLFI